MSASKLPIELQEILQNLSVNPGEIRSVHSPGNANTPWVLRTTDPDLPWAVAGRAFQMFSSLAAANQYLGEKQSSAEETYELVPMFGDPPVGGDPVKIVGKLADVVICTVPRELMDDKHRKQLAQGVVTVLARAGVGDSIPAIFPEGVKFFKVRKVPQ